jgi:hypothetical protein
MDGFDIGRITDADFEALCRDLLGNALGVRFELFAPGRDGGMDLRYVSPAGDTWIVQCKHWARSGRAALLSHMAVKERLKVDRLKPDRYLLATSVDLNPDAKKRLFGAGGRCLVLVDMATTRVLCGTRRHRPLTAGHRPSGRQPTQAQTAALCG